MKTETFNADGRQPMPFTLRDLVGIGFRHKRVLTLCFCGILLGAALAAFLLPAEYESSTKILVERERMDPVVSPGQSSPMMFRGEVTEEELNSEVELLQSEDVLRQVVLTCGLHHRKSLLAAIFGPGSEEKRIAKAVNRLKSDLQVGLIKKSNLIEVAYASPDSQLSAAVLRALDEAYLQENLAVHRPRGEFEFFDEETKRYRSNLAQAETQLKQFAEQEGGVAPQIARDMTLQKLSEFSASLQQTLTEIASTEKRIHQLEKEAGSTPARLTTQVRKADDAQVLQQLKGTLLNLELKRTELLTKYQPNYPLVQEVEKQITDTRAAIAASEAKPFQEETTDRNPTYAWIYDEMAKARAEYSSLQARAASLQAVVAMYQTKTRDLEKKGIVQQDLLRQAKTDEENYLLYQRKREEARMTDALDRTKILNVAIAEKPAVPLLAKNSPWSALLVGLFLSLTATAGLAFMLEFMDSSFRTPADVLDELDIPVLASVPRKANDLGSSNGNGNGNGNSNSNGNGHRAGSPWMGAARETEPASPEANQ